MKIDRTEQDNTLSVPFPSTPNLRELLRPLLLDYLTDLTQYPELCGVVLLGGAANGSRAFLDRFSDLDAAIFISVPTAASTESDSVRDFLDNNQTALPQWLPPFSSILPCSAHPDGEIEVNVHQLILELEERSTHAWDEAKMEVFSEAAEIMYDPSGRVECLVARKTMWDDRIARRLLLRLLGQARWYGVINPSRQIARGFPLHAQDLLNEAIEILIWIVYLVNRHYRPHKKWRIERCCCLPVLPGKFRERLVEAMYVPNMTEDNILHRSHIIEALLEDVSGLARSMYDLPKDLYLASCIESFDDRQLRKI